MVIHVSTPLSWRGGEQQIFYLLQGMKQAEWPCMILCPEGSEMEQRATKAGIIVHTWKKSSGISLILARKIARHAKEFSSCIIHAHDAQAHTAAVLANALFKAQTPVVLSRRVDFPVAQGLFSAWKYNHDSIKAIACVSEAIAEIVRSSVNHPERVRTIHSGIDSSRFKPSPKTGSLIRELNLPPDTLLIGNVAALADHKDYPAFLRSIKRLSDLNPSIHAVIAGTGPLETEIKSLARDLNLNEKVHFLGFRTDVPAWLPELDVFLFTSKTEGLGTSLLDALASGIPVVSTRAGGIPEIIEHGKNGLLAEPGDDEGLAQLVLRMLNEPNASAQFVENGLKTVSKFSVEAMVQKTTALYTEISSHLE